jgi:transposase
MAANMWICPESLFGLLLIDLDVAPHTTFSRRSKNLGDIKYIEQGSLDKYLNLYIDSSGLWTHNGNQGKPIKNKSWRKFHIAVDGKRNIVASQLTSNKATDASRVKRLMSKVDKPLTSASADSAYDNNQVYSLLSDHLKNKKSKILIPPKKNSIASDKSHPQRNRNIRSRHRYGKRTWIKKSKYNLRNRVENTFFRYKQIIGPTLKDRARFRVREWKCR